MREHYEQYNHLDLRVGDGARRDHSYDPRGAAADPKATSEPGKMVGLRARLSPDDL